MGRHIKYQTKQYQQTHGTHNSGWLILGWVATTKDHLRLKIKHKSHTWQVIDLYLRLQFLRHSSTFLFSFIYLYDILSTKSMLPISTVHAIYLDTGIATRLGFTNTSISFDLCCPWHTKCFQIALHAHKQRA